jgi:ribosomal protein S7
VKLVLTGLKPVIETESVKRAGSIYQVPHPVDEDRATTLAVR